MLKEANIFEKGSKEWKDARNKIRKDFEEEKKSKIENKSYNIDSSGSTDQAPSGNGAQSSVSRSTTASQAAGMGGGSRQATSAGSTSSGRTDSGWGW